MSLNDLNGKKRESNQFDAIIAGCQFCQLLSPWLHHLHQSKWQESTRLRDDGINHLYFPDLSHQGHPWIEETVALS